MITSSVALAQGELATVHLRVAEPEVNSPVTPDVAEDGVVIVAVPACTLQVPVPGEGVTPARVVVVAEAQRA